MINRYGTKARGWFLDPKYEWGKLKERIPMWIAWRIPRKLAYWCAIRVMTNATTGRWRNQVVPELSALDALDRWDNYKARSPLL